MFNGVKSVVYFCENLPAAAAWYEHILGIEPYRNDDSFVGFHLEGYDLCIHLADEKSEGADQVMYWIVDDLADTVESLVEEGCSIYRDIIDVPEGGKVAQLRDPFGNILGLSEILSPQTQNQ